MTGLLSPSIQRLTNVAALMVWLAFGSPVIKGFLVGDELRGAPVTPLWFIPFLLLGAAMVVPMVRTLRRPAFFALIGFELALVVTMAMMLSWAGMSHFLVILAWQVAMATTFNRAIGWAVIQTLVVTAALSQALNPDICWVIVKAFALQLLIVFTAQAFRREFETARALAATNEELRSAHAIIATSVRDAERLRISRELHDAWGHELTALGLQLEIASNVKDRERADVHVKQAKTLSRALLGKVRDVVSTLREAELCDLKDALETLADSVPSPTVHVDITPGIEVRPEQAHALIRCAQEAVTNAVRHSHAENLWLRVTAEGDGVRLVARNDGAPVPAASSPGSGLIGMRERLETLGGKLAVRKGGEFGFTVDAWLPSGAPQAT